MDVQALLLPLGWVAAFAVMYYGDRAIDRRIEGSAPKLIGSIPFWWVFVLMLLVGWVSAMFTVEDSPLPAWVRAVVLVVLAGAAALAFCARFGFRLRR